MDFKLIINIIGLIALIFVLYKMQKNIFRLLKESSQHSGWG